MEEIEEIWKEFEVTTLKTYYISNLGRVKTITKGNKKEKILKPDYSNNYGRIRIGKSNSKLKFVHHLVAYNFLGPRSEGLQIDHKDRNKLNNKANNLEYVTPFENNQNTDRYRSDILTTDPAERNKVFCKEYYEANREMITCDCGSIIQKNSKVRHEITKKHLNWLKNNP